MTADNPGHLKPIVVIGAARSGTKFLRDLLAASHGTRVVPYDVNFIWRSGNEWWPDDVLQPEMCTEQLKARIRKKLVRASESRAGGTSAFLIEKTVSNCLRVPFVDAALPDARYVHLLRDGRDVVESAMRMWVEPPDWRYLLAKLRTFPLGNFSYGIKFIGNQLRGRVSTRRARRTWGPRYPGIDEDVQRLDLLAICAKQWEECVTAATDGLSAIEPSRVVTIHYEDLILDPQVIAELVVRLGLCDADAVVRSHRAVADAGSIRASRRLDAAQQVRLQELLGPSLARFGYR